MPSIYLQTSSDVAENVDIPDVLEALVAELSSIETIDSRAIRAYHALRSVWAMGAGAQPGFAACQVSILSGRPEKLRAELADRMYARLAACFPESVAQGSVNLTLEVREMEAATYRK